MHQITPAERQAFSTQGFLVGVPVLRPDEVVSLRQRVGDLMARLEALEPELYEVEAAHLDRPDEVPCHFLGGWRVDEALRDLVFDPRITRPCADLLGVDRLRFWHDQVFSKPPGHPGVVPWHQDYAYWTRTAPACHITINIMLDDADEESGCVQFVPGSHRWGLLPPQPFDAPLDAILPSLTPAQRAQFQPQWGAVPAGSATIHDAHTLHGSAANRSTRPRRALVFNYMGPDVRVADGSAPLLRHTPLLATGERVAGPDFPIVFDRHGTVPPGRDPRR